MGKWRRSEVATGTRYACRLGIEDAGEEIFAGETWVTSEAPAFALEGVRPNPAIGGRVTAQFVLPAPGAATLELLDASGRKISEVEVGFLGAGRHTVELGGRQQVPPGVYVVRFTQGERRATARVVALK